MKSPFIALVALLAVLGGGSLAVADTTGLAMVRPRVDRTQFAVFVDDLPIDAQNRMIIDIIYEDYLAEVEALGDRLRAKAVDVGAGRVDDALAGRIVVHPDELRRLRIAVLDVERSGWTDADRLFDELLLNVREILHEVPIESLDEAERELRRAVWLAPRRTDERNERYAGDGVDLIVLVHAATAAGADLESIDADMLAPILHEYDYQLDEVLLATAAADRDGRLTWRRARIEGNAAAGRTADAAHLERWRQLYELNQSTSGRIESEIDAQLGADAAQRWRAVFHRACFPWIFRAARPEREFDWIERRVRDDAVIAKAAGVYNAYRTAADAACAAAVELVVDARVDRGTILHARMDPRGLDDGVRDLYERLLQISGERATLEADASSALRALLEDGQRKQMAADIAAAAYGRRR